LVVRAWQAQALALALGSGQESVWSGPVVALDLVSMDQEPEQGREWALREPARVPVLVSALEFERKWQG